MTVTVSDCRDPADNKLLELAASGGARFLITGDGDLLALHPWRDVVILTPRQLTEQA
jgi:predicted nucleic acid-binding protein